MTSLTPGSGSPNRVRSPLLLKPGSFAGPWGTRKQQRPSPAGSNPQIPFFGMDFALFCGITFQLSRLVRAETRAVTSSHHAVTSCRHPLLAGSTDSSDFTSYYPVFSDFFSLEIPWEQKPARPFPEEDESFGQRNQNQKPPLCF